MHQLASEEDANLQSEDETESSAFSVQTSASPAEEFSIPLLPPLFTANQEPLPLLSQYHNTGDPENISVAANSPLISSENHLPSPAPVLQATGSPEQEVVERKNQSLVCKTEPFFTKTHSIVLFLMTFAPMRALCTRVRAHLTKRSPVLTSNPLHCLFIKQSFEVI